MSNMFSIPDFSVIRALKTSPKVTSIVIYGSVARGDEKTKDADFLVFTRGKNYETPLSVYDILLENDIDPNKTDIYIHSDEELDGILCNLFEPSSYDHIVNNGKVIFCEEENPIEKLKPRKNIWYDVSKKLGVWTLYLQELSNDLIGIRNGYLQIMMLIPERKQMEKNTEKIFKKTLNHIRGTKIMMEGLAILGISLGSSDDPRNIINRFFDEYSSGGIEKYREVTLEMRDFDPKEHRKFSDKELIEIVKRSKKTGERCIKAIDEKLCEKFESLISSSS